jgi:hypothetical protein
MLTIFYAFLVISMLGSSAIAMPELLLGNKDYRLTTGLWTLSGTLEPGLTPLWTDSWDLDYVIRFKGDHPFQVEKVDIGRIVRSLKYGAKDSLVEYAALKKKSEVVGIVKEDVPVEEWPANLRDTKWIRLPNILGLVSDSIIIWKS